MLGKTKTTNEIAYPVLHFSYTVFVIENPERIRYVTENSIHSATTPNYYWDAEGKWYRSVNIRKVKRASFWRRFTGPDDLIIADFELEELASAIQNWAYYYKQLYYAVEFPKNRQLQKEARRALRDCSTSLEMIEWIRKYDPDYERNKWGK